MPEVRRSCWVAESFLFLPFLFLFFFFIYFIPQT